jgi:hypothetical protein
VEYFEKLRAEKQRAKGKVDEWAKEKGNTCQ